MLYLWKNINTATKVAKKHRDSNYIVNNIKGKSVTK